MSRSARIGIAAGIAAAFILAAAWYFASPRWTLHQMKSAAEAHDGEAFASYIDFPVLRESLKTELKAAAARELVSSKGGNGFEALGLMLATQMVDPMVDAMVTPEALEASFSAGATTRSKLVGGVKVGDDVSIERVSLDEFRLRSGEDKEAWLVFKRSGLGWKLAGMKLPAESLPR